MDILFKTDKLKRLCSEERVMKRSLNAKGSRKLRARLADLHAAANMREVKRGRPHPLFGEFAGCLALELAGGWRLVIESAEDPPPLLADGSLDWSHVTAVRVVFVGDYHE